MNTRRYVVIGGWVFSLLVAGVLSWWACTLTLGRPSTPESTDKPLLVTVSEGTLGRTLIVPVQAVWVLSPLATTPTQGTVTSVDVVDGAEVKTGDALLSINLRPVIIAQGDVPSFRDLTIGDWGKDVAQLQNLLANQGFFVGEADGVFAWDTTVAVLAWQKSLGVEQSGIVQASDIVYAPTLPTRIAVAPGLKAGAMVNVGDDLVSRVDESPTFTAVVDASQLPWITPGSTVTIASSDGSWVGIVEDLSQDKTSAAMLARLGGENGGAVCGDACVSGVLVRADGTATILEGSVVVVPQTSGALVPTVAVSTDATGQTSVTLEDGSITPVDVVASQDGQSIVTGVGIGTRVRIVTGS